MFARRPGGVAPLRFDRAVLVAALAFIAGCGQSSVASILPFTSAAAHDSSRQAQAASGDIVAINVGGGAVGSFVADVDGVGGTVNAVTDTINVSAANAAPAAVYQTQRYGRMTYTIPNLTPGTSYIARLHFAETYFGKSGRPGVGQRLFDVAVNGVAALTNFDVYAAAGAADTAVVRDIPATAGSAGQIVIAFTDGAANNPFICGIEILPVAAPTPTPAPTPAPTPVPTFAPAISIDVGGPLVAPFVADVDGLGGTPYSSTDKIDTSAANAAPAAVYQTQRYGRMTYTIPGLTPGGPYTVRLHFAELYFGVHGHAGGAGSRVFNVAFNGVTALANVDVFAAAGAADKAVVIDTPATADAHGNVTIALTNGSANNPMLSALQIIPLAGPTPPPVGSETPRSSDAFVDSAGINVHLAYYGTLYGDNFSAVAALLQGAGLRHVRDGTDPGNAAICNEDVALAAAGTHVDVIAPLATTDLVSWLSCIGSAAESVEGLNEYDASGDPNWAAVLRANVSSIVAAVPGLPLIAPSLTSQGDAATLGSLASSVAFGNTHAYFAGRNPGTIGWGATDAYGTYGSLADNLAVAGLVSGTKPVDVTETGYSDQSDVYAVPSVTKARYSLRTYLNDWVAGVPRTYLYELVDEGPAPYAHYGIVTAAGTPKPAYTAIAALLAHLADPGGTFSVTPLNYTLTAPSTVEHVLLQKRNGTYELIVWNEVPEWDPNANAVIPTTPQSVQLTFAKAPTSVQMTTFADTGVATTAAMASQTTIGLTAGAWPTIVDIVP